MRPVLGRHLVTEVHRRLRNFSLRGLSPGRKPSRFMLKGISPLLGPDLLHALASMGHGDDIVLADAHYPATSMGRRVIRADGLGVVSLLEAVLPVLELDSYSEPVCMMGAVPGDELDPDVEASYVSVIRRFAPGFESPSRLDRFAFYERSRAAFAIVATGETAKYGNVILRKGVTPP